MLLLVIERCDAFNSFQCFLNVDHHLMLRAGQPGWLSLKMCFHRLLKQHEPVKRYFRGVALEDPSHTIYAVLTSA